MKIGFLDIKKIMSEFRPQSFRLKLNNNGSLSNSCKERRSFADRFFSKETKTQKEKKVFESPTQSPMLMKQSVPGILRHQNKLAKSKSERRLEEKDLKVELEKNELSKSLPIRKVAFKEHIESTPKRPPLQRQYGIEMELWELDDDNNFFNCSYEDLQKISDLKDYLDAPTSTLLDSSTCTCSKQEAYLSSFGSYKIESEEDSEEDCNYNRVRYFSILYILNYFGSGFFKCIII